MNFLIDTHIFIWWILDNPKLSKNFKKVISNVKNNIYLSSASTWEMVIKSSIGKLTLPEPADVFIKRQLYSNEFYTLNITIEHTFEVLKLPIIHKDPFDRILIAQARCENMSIITDEPLIKQYDVQVL